MLRPLGTGRLNAPRIGFAVFLASFTLFAVTTSPLVGYEPETAAVTEGLVEHGEPRIVRGGSLTLSAQRGPDGGLYGRATLPQPLLEVPFYSAGKLFDAVRGSGADSPGRRDALMFFNPFMAALGAAAVFGIVLLRIGSVRWGLAVAAAFSLGSLAWPYSKIGVETTFMSLAAMTLFLVLLSLRRDRVALWALTGVVAGAAAIAKNYAVVAVAPLFLPLLACVGT